MDKRAFAQIDLSRLRENYRRVRSLTRARVLCTVKADAYGHGACECVRALEAEGADFFCVATAAEALEIRRISNSEILVLGYIPSCRLAQMAKNGITVSLFSPEYARAVAAALDGRRIRAHIAINSGMNRLGFSFEDKEELLRVKNHPSFEITGAYSHLFCADMAEDLYSMRQIEKFRSALSSLGGGIMTHISNSAGVQRYGAQGFDGVRVGMALYGHGCTISGFLPVMTLHARVVWIRNIKKGERVGYGAHFAAEGDVKIATLSIGYADGLARLYAGGTVIFPHCRGKIVGRICMDLCMVALKIDADISLGDYGCIFDKTGKNTRALSALSGLTPYEQLTAVGKRVERIYIE